MAYIYICNRQLKIWESICFLVSGELSRCFSKKQISVILSNLQIAAVTCVALGPVSPVLFGSINFKFLGFVVNQYNFIGLLEAGLVTLYEILVFFFFTNLTLHPGYQVYLRRNQEEDGKEQILSVLDDKTERAKEDESYCTKNNSSVKLLSVREVITNIDIFMILAETTLINFIVTQAELVINIVAVTNFQWSIERLSVVTVIAAVLSIVAMMFSQRLKTGEDAYFLVTVCLVANWITLCILVLATNFSITGYALQTVVLVFTLFLYIIPGFNVAPWSLVLLYIIVPEHSRCFISGIRQAVCKIGSAFGFLTAAFLYSSSAYVYPVMEVCCFALAVLFLVRRKKFFELYHDHHRK